MKIYAAIFAAALLYSGFIPERSNNPSKKGQQPSSNVNIGANFLLYPSQVTQTETFISKHPTDPNTMFVCANTMNLQTGFKSEGIYVTTNGGNNWRGNDTCTGSVITFHAGEPGIAIDKNGIFVLIRWGYTPGLFSHFSTNNGSTWSSQKRFTDVDADRPSLVTDAAASSPYYGRTYASWVRHAPPYRVYTAYTQDGGSTWSDTGRVNNPSQRGQSVEIETGPNGEVYTTWGVVGPASPFVELHTGFARSTNGTLSWTVSESAFQMNGIQGQLSSKGNIRVNGLPRIDVDKTGGARNGWIYIVTTEKNRVPAGSDPDIIFHRSSDGGSTWSNAIRVNQDGLNNGKIQYFPSVKVDGNGGVNVIYYDDRRTTSDSAEVYMSRSTNGGDTWTDFPISDHKFKPSPIGGFGAGYQGDNIDMEFTNNTLWPVWMDNSTGRYQVWTVPIDLNSIGINDPVTTVPGEFDLMQNYPNPFNPSTTIEYNLVKGGDVELKLYSISGEEIEILFTGRQTAGSYKYVFNSNENGSARNLASGIYFYKLGVGEFTAVKRMMLIK